jgi:hypothetical protein
VNGENAEVVRSTAWALETIQATAASPERQLVIGSSLGDVKKSVTPVRLA